MSRTNKPLIDPTPLTTALTTIYTAPANTNPEKTEIVEIVLTNTDPQLSKTVGLVKGPSLAYRYALINKIVIPKGETIIVSGTHITLNAADVLGAVVDVITAGTAQAGAAGTITLASGSNATDDYYNGATIRITNNTPTGVQNQSRKITDYTGSTKVATIDTNWATNPTSSTTYTIGDVFITLHGIEVTT